MQGISQCCKSSRSAWRAAEKEQRGAGNGRPWKIAISCLVNIFPWQQGGTAIYLEMQQVPDIRPRALSGNFPGQSHFPIFLSGSPSLVSSWNAAYVSPSASWAYTGLCEGGPPPPRRPVLKGKYNSFSPLWTLYTMTSNFIRTSQKPWSCFSMSLSLFQGVLVTSKCDLWHQNPIQLSKTSWMPQGKPCDPEKQPVSCLRKGNMGCFGGGRVGQRQWRYRGWCRDADGAKCYVEHLGEDNSRDWWFDGQEN